MINDPDPSKKKKDTAEIPGNDDLPYVEPEEIDTQEPEDLDSDEERV
jgi:hypothetical protein